MTDSRSVSVAGRLRPTTLTRAVRGALVVAALAGGMVTAMTPELALAQESAGSGTRFQFQIPSGPLGPALADFALIASVNVSAVPDLLANVSTAGLTGSFSAEAGLAQLLAGTGLRATATTGRSYVLQRVPASTSSVTTLQPVQVVSDPGITEGTTTYLAAEATSANRLGLSLRETPQSITVVTRQRLDDMGAKSVNEALAQVTGLYVTENDTERTSVFSRGYAISNVQVDGLSNIQSGGYNSLNPDTAVYDRIDVVRGATGLMTGSGDPSGSVSMMRKRPTREFAASVTGSVGRWSNYRGEVDIGGPIAWDGRVRARVVAVRHDTESFRDNYSMDKRIFYGIVEADITPSTTVAIGIDYQDPRPGGTTWGTVPYWMADGSEANLPRSTSFAPAWSSWPLKQNQVFGRLEHVFDNGWELKASIAHDRKRGDGKVWYGGSGYPRADGTGMSAWTMHSITDMRTDSFDLSAKGGFSLFGREHELVFGYGQVRNRRDSVGVTYLPDPTVDYAIIPDWRNWSGDIPVFETEVTPFNTNEITIRQKAGYVTLRLNPVDALHVILGARVGSYNYETRNYSDQTGAFVSASGYDVKNEVTPYFGVVYDVTQDWSVYASYTDIFKPQDYRDADGNFLKPIVGDNVEVGVKGELFDGRLLASAAVFGGKQSNLAERDESRDLVPGSFDPRNPPAGYNSSGYWTLPDGSVPYQSTGTGNRVRGAEFEVQGAITDDWSVSAGFTYTRVRNSAGDRIQTNRPLRLVRLNTAYRLPGDWRRLTVGGGVTWQSEIYQLASRPTGALNANGGAITTREPITQKSFALVNVMARYDVTDNFSATLNINNLFDKHYYRNVGFYNGVHWGEPRSYMLTARYQF